MRLCTEMIISIFKRKRRRRRWREDEELEGGGGEEEEWRWRYREQRCVTRVGNQSAECTLINHGDDGIIVKCSINLLQAQLHLIRHVRRNTLYSTFILSLNCHAPTPEL